MKKLIKKILSYKKLNKIILFLCLFYFVATLIVGYISFRIIFFTNDKPLDYKNTINNLIEHYSYFDKDTKKVIYFLMKRYKDIKQIKINSFDNTLLNGYILENNIMENNNNWIIVSHGYRTQAISFASLILLYNLHNLGFNILIIDNRAHGLSEGKFSTLGFKERLDIKEWIIYISKNYPNSEIATYGFSMGATTTLLACGEKLPKNFKLCISDSAFNSCYDTIKYFATTILHINNLLSSFILSGTFLISKIVFNFDMNFYTENFLKNSLYPIMFIHGENDTTIKLNTVYNMYKNYKGEHEILIIKDCDHCLGMFKNENLYWNAIYDFTRKHMGFSSFDKITISNT